MPPDLPQIGTHEVMMGTCRHVLTAHLAPSLSSVAEVLLVSTIRTRRPLWQLGLLFDHRAGGWPTIGLSRGWRRALSKSGRDEAGSVGVVLGAAGGGAGAGVAATSPAGTSASA